MKSAFDIENSTWNIDWPGRVSRHDLVYLSPPEDPMQGIPLGNGDVGALCWCEDSKLIFAVNKCDLWDDAEFDRFHNWDAQEEEHSTTLRHAYRIIVDFGLPVFDTFYLSNFVGRLSIADASLSITSESPFGNVSIRAFVNHDDGVIYCDVDTSLCEDVPVDVSIQRYGSRTFSHWYKLINRDPSIGLRGTSSSADEAGAYLQHVLTSGVFSIGCRATRSDGLTVNYSRDHSHRARMQVSGAAKKSFSFASMVTSPSDNQPIDLCKSRLDKIQSTCQADTFSAHNQSWKEFWMRSLMECGDDYLDNLWHLTMYYAYASQRGSYPGRFIGGLWGWNRDVQPWNFYFHWNQQETYWPLNAAGHDDLVSSYLQYRFDSLPHAKADARDIFHTDGAIVSDVCDRRGYNSVSEFHNHTPVAQIALDFWRQYRFTKDLEFLKTQALPYMLEAAYFFESLFEIGDDGKYHAKEGTAYEGWILLRDPITEICCASMLFASVIEALNETGVMEPRAEKWAEIIGNLAPVPETEADKLCIQKNGDAYRLGRGMFSGDEVLSNHIFASGFGIKEQKMLTGFLPLEEEFIKPDERGMRCNDGIFPTADLSPVFPSGLIGLSQKGEGVFDLAVNTAKLYSPECMGWDVLPVVLARLGLADELYKVLAHFPSHWQFYCNGFGHYGPRETMKAESTTRFHTSTVEDAQTSVISGFDWSKKKDCVEFRFPTWPFRHMGMESMSVLACAINESLLQSHDGIIRVVPAIMGDRRARFSLHAAGGFVVSSEIENGKPLWISIKSRLGGVCKLENPWNTAYVYENENTYNRIDNAIIEIQTNSGGIYTIVSDLNAITGWTVEPTSYQENKQPKTYDNEGASLGIARMF